MKLQINQRYKDRMFRLVFGTKKDLLDLYNAVNGSSYTDSEALEITTLEDVIYISMKNDVSFLIDEILNLYEHQSTYNPNMPVRGFLYLAEVYRKYIESRKLKKGKQPELIAGELEEDAEKVIRICSAAKAAAPDYDSSRIYAILHGE